MKKYILIVIGGRQYRLEIDSDLDTELRKSLKDKYRFDENNYLFLNPNDLNYNYQSKQLVFKALLNQIGSYQLSPELESRLEALKEYVNPKKASIYHSDLKKLEDLLSEASQIYNSIRGSVPKKSEKKVEETVETLDTNVTETLEDTAPTITSEEVKKEEASRDANDRTILELKEVLDDFSTDDSSSSEVPVEEINKELDKIEVCATIQEYEEKTGHSAGSYDALVTIKRAKENNSKIILPPTASILEVTSEIIRTTCKDEEAILKVTEYVKQKGSYSKDVTDSFNKLRSNLKVSGFNSRNLNYYGDQFIDQFIEICNESGTSFESMFADYFNGYSTARKYNSALDKFIRQFITYNGGDENTRALLEAMLVKKAISKHLISSSYNRYLNPEYQNLDVSGNGTIRFDDNMLNRVSFKPNYQVTGSGGETEGLNVTGLGASTEVSNSSPFTANANINSSLGRNGQSTANLNTKGNISQGFQANRGVSPKNGVSDTNQTFQADQDLVASKNANLNSFNQPNGSSSSSAFVAPIIVGASTLAGGASGLASGINDHPNSSGSQSVQAMGANARKNRARGAKNNSKLNGALGSGALPNIPGHAKGTASGRAYSTNQDLNPALYSDLDDEESKVPHGTEEGEAPDIDADSINNPSLDQTPPREDGTPIEDNQKPDEEGADSKKKKKFFREFIKKHPYALVLLGIIAMVGLILLLILLAASGDKNNNGHLLSSYISCDKITIVNSDGSTEELDFEYYVAGVVTGESGLAEYPEATKAQAVIARTFAVRYTNSCTTTISNSTATQVFKEPDQVGLDAAEETKGIIMVDQENSENLIGTYFASYPKEGFNSGGSSFPAFPACKAVDCTSDTCSTTFYRIGPNNAYEEFTLSMDRYKANGSTWNGADLTHQQGHCFGLSQVAARYLDSEGKDYKEILETFFYDFSFASMLDGNGLSGYITSLDWYQVRMDRTGITTLNYWIANNIFYQSRHNLIGQCTWYSHGRAREIMSTALENGVITEEAYNNVIRVLNQMVGNANTWWTTNKALQANGLSYSSDTPKIGSIVVFNGSSNRACGTYYNAGHVGIVENVFYDDEGNWTGVWISDGWKNYSCDQTVCFQSKYWSKADVLNYRNGCRPLLGFIYLLDYEE